MNIRRAAGATRSSARFVVSAVCLLACSQALAQAVTYVFSTGDAPTGDPTLTPLFAGVSVNGSFVYQPDVPATGTLPAGSQIAGGTIYADAIIDLQGTVAAESFSDPGGIGVVGDDRFVPAPVPPPPGFPADILLFTADPGAATGPGSFDLSGFEVAGFNLVNVRIFWLENLLATPDFLSNQDLPDNLPGFPGRLALDFANVDHPGARSTVFFDGLLVAQGRMSVAIDVKPGSDPNCFNINGRGVIPVAILGSDSFDVSQVDSATLLFGGLSVRLRGNRGPLCGLEYANGDGALDLVCHFEDSAGHWQAGAGEATLTGALLDGTEFQGSDSICVVP